MQEIIDDFYWSKENKVITRDRHNVPGLANISHWNYKSAISPAPFHFHKNIYEFHVMIHGRRIFQVADPGDPDKIDTLIVTGNQVAITFPGEPHGYQDNFVEPYEFYSVQIDVTDPDHLLGLDVEYSRELYSILQETQKLLTRNHDHRLELGSTHIQLFRSAFTFFSDFQPSSIRTGVQFLCCFLFGIRYLSPISDTEQIDPQIQLCLKYMRDNYKDNPPLSEIASQAGYSLSYFKYKFKLETGITPANALNIMRMEYAKDRLANSACSITMLASELNFSSASHFCSAFKKLTTFTPKEYRDKAVREAS